MPYTKPSFLEHVREKSHTYFVNAWFANPALERGLLLDLPAGNTKDTEALQQQGYRVVSGELFPEENASKDIDWVCADMCEKLPFADASFDYFLNSEGIEHISDQFSLLKECHRVLKPGGTLAITTPNLLSVRARLAFALAGNRAFKSFVDEETSVWGQDGNRIYHGHAFLINYFQLRYMLHHSGFTIKEIVGTHYGSTSITLLPLLAPLVRLFTNKAMKKAKKKNPGSTIYKNIAHDVYGLPMLLSKNLFVVAEKR